MDTPQIPTRWRQERSDQQSHEYVARFRELAAAGADLDGEARFVHERLAPGATVLDAGCGTGRVGAALASRGHRVTGVDVDPILLAEARTHRALTVIEADLATLDLGSTRFDAVVAAGNVMVFVAPGSERAVLERMAAHLHPGGLVVLGFATDRSYTADQCVDDLVACGFAEVERYATWDADQWREDASWVVLTARAAGAASAARVAASAMT